MNSSGKCKLVRNTDQQTALHILPSGTTLDDPISEAESRHISGIVNSASLLDIPQTTLSELLVEFSAISDTANLRAVLNSPESLNDEESRQELSKARLQEKFDGQAGNKEESEISLEKLLENKQMDLPYLIEAASKALE